MVIAVGRGKANPVVANPAVAPAAGMVVPIIGDVPLGLLRVAPVPTVGGTVSSFVSSAIFGSTSSGASKISIPSTSSCLKRCSDDVVDAVSLSNNSGSGDESEPRVLRVRTILIILSYTTLWHRGSV